MNPKAPPRVFARALACAALPAAAQSPLQPANTLGGLQFAVSVTTLSGA